jgi:hypothetical protein
LLIDTISFSQIGQFELLEIEERKGPYRCGLAAGAGFLRQRRGLGGVRVLFVLWQVEMSAPRAYYACGGLLGGGSVPPIRQG